MTKYSKLFTALKIWCCTIYIARANKAIRNRGERNNFNDRSTKPHTRFPIGNRRLTHESFSSKAFHTRFAFHSSTVRQMLQRNNTHTLCCGSVSAPSSSVARHVIELRIHNATIWTIWLCASCVARYLDTHSTHIHISNNWCTTWTRVCLRRTFNSCWRSLLPLEWYWMTGCLNYSRMNVFVDRV